MMQMAFFMGLHSLYLLGIDFDFVVPPRWVGATGKFKIYVSQGERNHFHPEYRKPGEKWHQPNLAYQEKAFLAARRFAASKNRKIYNATRGGRLEIFPRVDVENLLSK